MWRPTGGRCSEKGFPPVRYALRTVSLSHFQLNQNGKCNLHTWRDAIDKTAEKLFPSLVKLRRHLHAHPELSGRETNTAAYLQDALASHQIHSTLVADGRGILVDMDLTAGDSADESTSIRRFGLRADMDALQIQDTKTVDYKSSVDNVMHACGHDVHSSILAGTLATLNELDQQDQLPWPVALRGIFQPAEEICQGAAEMISYGAAKGVDALLALHVDPFREVGKVGFRSGVMSASCDELIITIKGLGGHAARPHHTKDPITAAAQFLNAVHVQIPRGADSLDTVVIGFGCIRGGDQCNVIPDTVSIRGTLRALTQQTREATLRQLRKIANGIGDASDTKIEIAIGANTPAVTNDIELTELAEREIVQWGGLDAADKMPQPSMGGEDFAYYLQHVPGMLLRVGSTTRGAEPTGLHTPNFDVDEDVIRIGVQLMCRICIEWSKP